MLGVIVLDEDIYLVLHLLDGNWTLLQLMQELHTPEHESLNT